MNKIFCVGVALLLCFGLCGCKDDTLPPLTSDDAEMVVAESVDYISGVIIGKMEPNALVLKIGSVRLAEVWGDTVYVITDDADKWCVDDEITVEFSKSYRPYAKNDYVRIIADEVWATVYSAKPILYFYPETPTVCSVKLTLDGTLTCTYPAHGVDGWQGFTAHPHGTLVFPDGKEYYALYWEGEQNVQWDFSKGFCVRGEDTAAFLEWALAEQGLTRREANEFIVYWLPLMQDNPYNVISFQTATYTGTAALDISPTPDTLVRVFMAYYPSDTEVDIRPQAFDEVVRQGFTVVEWGGSQTEKP